MWTPAHTLAQQQAQYAQYALQQQQTQMAQAAQAGKQYRPVYSNAEYVYMNNQAPYAGGYYQATQAPSSNVVPTYAYQQAAAVQPQAQAQYAYGAMQQPGVQYFQGPNGQIYAMQQPSAAQAQAAYAQAAYAQAQMAPQQQQQQQLVSVNGQTYLLTTGSAPPAARPPSNIQGVPQGLIPRSVPEVDRAPRAPATRMRGYPAPARPREPDAVTALFNMKATRRRKRARRRRDSDEEDEYEEATTASEEEDEPHLEALRPGIVEEHWIQCDECSKWRRVPKHVVDEVGDSGSWACKNHPTGHITCETPEEAYEDRAEEEPPAKRARADEEGEEEEDVGPSALDRLLSAVDEEEAAAALAAVADALAPKEEEGEDRDPPAEAPAPAPTHAPELPAPEAIQTPESGLDQVPLKDASAPAAPTSPKLPPAPPAVPTA